MEDVEEEQKLFAIFDWVDGYSVQTLTAIVKPRKDVGDYEKGERVQAKCYGHPGLHWGTLAAIDGDKIWLNQKAKGTRPIIDERTNNDGKDTSAEQKDESRNEISNTKKRKINKRIEFEGEKDLSSSEEEKVEEEADEDMVVILPPNKKGKTVKMIDEGKKAKAEASKKKREVNNERKKVAEKLSKVILDTPDTKTCSCNPETIQRIENKLDQVLCLVESLAECKYCLKKAYKRTSEKVPAASTPCTSSGSSVTVKEMVSTDNHKNHENDKKETEKEKSISDDLNNISAIEETSFTVGERDKSDEDEEKNDETTFVGPRKYGVTISTEILERSKNVSKTPEKLVLNIIKYMLTDYEINNCTVYGNKQFRKEALPEQKRKAIRSVVLETFPSCKLEEIWCRLVIVINDKIRGLRNGKYKD